MSDLSLDHQKSISQACHILQHPISEYNFTNLYLFRKKHSYSVEIFAKDQLVILGTSYTGERFLMPLFHPTDWPALLTSFPKAQYIYPIPEEKWPEIQSQGLHITVSETQSDYLFETQHIQTLKGRHMAKHRNIIRQLHDNYTISVKKFSQDLQNDVFHIADIWAEEKNGQTDIEPFKEGVKLAAQLNLEGWVFYASTNPVGTLFGQSMTDTIYLVHFSKELPEYRGLSQYMHQSAAQQTTLPFLNWEQDLGIEGLRQFKHSFQPIQMVQKGEVRFR